jgi:hypothetical protein
LIKLTALLCLIQISGFAALVLLASCSANEHGSFSSVILIFDDDLSYGDIACYASELHETPNLDQIEN